MLCRFRFTTGRLAFVMLIMLTGLFASSCLAPLFNQPPKPLIGISEGSPYGPAPLTVTFDISGSSDADGEIVSFTFDFGDEADPIHGTDLSQALKHTYTTPGSYLAKLTVVDNAGEERHMQTPIIVSEPAQANH